MGADGTIDIYDLEKLEEILGKKYERPDTSHTYIHSFKGKKVVTDYHGDNLWNWYCFVCGKGRDECPDQHWKMTKSALITNWEVWT